MASTKEKMYTNLIKAYTAAYSKSKNGKTIQLEVAKEWAMIKNCENLEEIVRTKVATWKKVELAEKSKLLSMWSKVKLMYYVLKIPKNAIFKVLSIYKLL